MRSSGHPFLSEGVGRELALLSRRGVDFVKVPTVPGGEIVVFQDGRGRVRLEVRLEGETVWLTQAQMAKLFGRERSVITRHIRNIFKEKELEEKSNVHFLHIPAADRPVAYYSLDVIISTGYRVKSRRGTQFRIWATRTLKDHLLKGYSLNEKRLRERGLAEVEQAVGLLARTLTGRALVSDEGRAVLEVIQQYARSWRWLFEYDEGRLPAQPSAPVAPGSSIAVAEARAAIEGLRVTIAEDGEAGPLFGLERGHGLEAILGAVEQTFDSRPLYPNAQERAAHILYFVIKDHPFSDGNKRIGALLFLEYLRRNGLLVGADGGLRFADNGMVALTLLIAESEASQKDLMIRLVLSLMSEPQA